MQDYIHSSLLRLWLLQLIIRKMNIRRCKKKKVTPIHQNQEEIAKNKLFEISYYTEEKDVDESQILAIDHRHYDPDHNTKRRTQQLERLIRGKIQELPQENKRRRMSKMESNLERYFCPTLPTYEKCIYNVLDSNSVFVGINPRGRHAPSSHNKEIMLIESRQRMQTMPELSQQQNYHKQKLKTQNSQRISWNLICTNYQKFHKPSYSVNKKNYFKLKERLRHDIFVKSLNSTIHYEK